MKMIRVYFALLLIGIAGGAYAYYTSSQSTIALLRENNVKLVAATEMLQTTTDLMEANQALNEELNKELSTKLQQAEGKMNSLRKRFSQIDIAREAQVDPDNMAIRINRAVDRLREELKNETTSVDPSAITPE